MKKGKMMQRLMMLMLLVTGLLVVSAQAAETIIYQDDFSDDTHNFRGDGTLTIVDDSAGLGGGKALRWSGGAYSVMHMPFTETSLALEGDSISLSYAIRYGGTTWGDYIRLGFADDTSDAYNSYALTYNGFMTRLNGTSTFADRVYGYAANKLCQNTGTEKNFGPSVGMKDTSPHQFKMTVTRTAAGVDVKIDWDGTRVFSGSYAGAFDTFDSVGIKNGSGGVPVLIDNVLLTYSVGPHTEAWDPLPADGQGLGTGELFLPVTIDTVLSWQGPNVAEPNVVAGSYKYAVYMDPDPNKVNSGIGCAYSSSFSSSTYFDPIPNMAYLKQYYWRVDIQKQFDYKPDPNSFKGDVWTFKTENQNTAPIVTAGRDLLTWTAIASTGIQLVEPTLLDTENDAVITWTAIPDTGISFDNAATLHPVVTISAVPVPGTPLVYTLTVTADDSVNDPSMDTMTIKVTANACEASKVNPLISHNRNRGDYNDDCLVNMEDFAGFASEWLNNTSETANIWY